MSKPSNGARKPNPRKIAKLSKIFRSGNRNCEDLTVEVGMMERDMNHIGLFTDEEVMQAVEKSQKDQIAEQNLSLAN